MENFENSLNIYNTAQFFFFFLFSFYVDPDVHVYFQ